MLKACFLLVWALFVLSAPAQAQSLTPAEVLQLVEKKVSGVNEYQKLLNDPDPARSMAAMEIMMGSGDPALMRMALEYGLYSPNRSVQRAALDAYFSTKPELNVYFDAGKSNSDWRFYKPITGGGGSILPDGTGFMLTDVGEYDSEKKCYLRTADGECRLRVTDDAVTVRFWNNWHVLRLNEKGELAGAGAFPDLISVSTLIPVVQ